MVKRWKIAFFILLATFLATIVTLFALYKHYFPAVEESAFPLHTETNPDDPIFTVSATKQQLESLINEKLNDYNRDNDIQYTFSIGEDDLRLQGAIPFIGEHIPFEIIFTPQVLDNGNVMLNEQSMRLGLLQLPEGKVLEYVKRSAVLPEWVTIFPEERKIYIALKEIEIEDQFYLRAEHVNLARNSIDFSVYTLR